jgi:hypothetical protein
MIAACSGGECPERKTGLWCILLAAIVMLVSGLFPDMKIPAQRDITQRR